MPANMQIVESRLATFKTWPADRSLIQQLAASGLYFVGTRGKDTLRCYYCQANIEGWTNVTDPLEKHRSVNSECVAVTLDREESRLATFVNWPHTKPTAQKMAQAGFVYRPTLDSADMAVCFKCDLGLDGWEPKDNPTQEHAKRDTNCRFLRGEVNEPANNDTSSQTTKGRKRVAKALASEVPKEQPSSQRDEEVVEDEEKPRKRGTVRRGRAAKAETADTASTQGNAEKPTVPPKPEHLSPAKVSSSSPAQITSPMKVVSPAKVTSPAKPAPSPAKAVLPPPKFTSSPAKPALPAVAKIASSSTTEKSSPLEMDVVTTSPSMSLLSADEANMTVEQFLLKEIDVQIAMLKSENDSMVQRFLTRSAETRVKLLQVQ